MEEDTLLHPLYLNNYFVSFMFSNNFFLYLLVVQGTFFYSETLLFCTKLSSIYSDYFYSGISGKYNCIYLKCAMC